MAATKEQMNDLNQQLINHLYGPYHVVDKKDSDAEWIFENLCEFLSVIDAHRKSVHLHIIQSDIGIVETIRNNDSKHFSIMWDVGYWALCHRFLSTIYTLYLSRFDKQSRITSSMCTEAINQLL